MEWSWAMPKLDHRVSDKINNFIVCEMKKMIKKRDGRDNNLVDLCPTSVSINTMDLKLILFCHKCTIFKLFMGEELMSRLYIYL